VKHDLADQLGAALTQEVRKKLLAYAYSLVTKRAWPGEGDMKELAQDIVQEAVVKAFAGDRCWNPEVNPDPKDFLFSSVSSVVDSRNRHSRNKLNASSLDTPSAQHVSSEEDSAQEKIEAEEFFCGLVIELGDDEVCVKLLDLYEKGYKPDEVAVVLKLETEEIYAANKRLKRKTRAYLQERREAYEHA